MIIEMPKFRYKSPDVSYWTQFPEKKNKGFRQYAYAEGSPSSTNRDSKITVELPVALVTGGVYKKLSVSCNFNQNGANFQNMDVNAYAEIYDGSSEPYTRNTCLLQYKLTDKSSQEWKCEKSLKELMDILNPEGHTITRFYIVCRHTTNFSGIAYYWVESILE